MTLNDKKDYNLYKGIAYWEMLLFLPSLLLISRLPGDSLLDIILNVFIIIFVTIGLFATSRFIREIIKKNKQNK